MTINEFAKKRGISTQAVYQRMKKSSVDLKAIKDAKTGELTEEGLETLNNLFSKDGTTADKEKTALIDKIAALKNELNTERLKNELLNKRLEELESDRDRWHAEAIEQRELAKAAQQSISVQAQALGAANVKLLMDGGGKSRKLSFLERITGRIKEEPQPAEVHNE